MVKAVKHRLRNHVSYHVKMAGIENPNSNVVSQIAIIRSVEIVRLNQAERKKFFAAYASYQLRIWEIWTSTKKNLLDSAEAACSNSLMWELINRQDRSKVGILSGPSLNLKMMKGMLCNKLDKHMPITLLLISMGQYRRDLQ